MARKNNAIILSKLGSLLDMLEARAIVSIYVANDAGEESLLTDHYTVYQVYDVPYYEKLKYYDVIGFSVALNAISIVIKKGV